MNIGDLYGNHEGEDIYIVGTGPSMQVFPVEILKGKTCIGLNQAWKYDVKLEYSITVHPELIVEYETAKRRKELKHTTKWCCRAQKKPLNLTYADPRYYVFTSHKPIPTHGFNPNLVRQRWEKALYIGRGIHQSAMNLAYHMGAKTIFLVGTDMCSLDGTHHGHNQHVQLHGLPAEDVYHEYRAFTDHIREVIHELGVPVVTLSPFIGLDHADEDFVRLRDQKGLEPLPTPKDTSKYNRRKTTTDPRRYIGTRGADLTEAE